MNSQNPAASLATSHHRTAVLDRTSGPLCNAARDTRRSGHALEPLEGVNPLGVPLDRQREWYHSQAIQRMQQAGLLGP
jgi:ATP/maltotriose-dependent transcriptional regulator MalT